MAIGCLQTPLTLGRVAMADASFGLLVQKKVGGVPPVPSRIGAALPVRLPPGLPPLLFVQTGALRVGSP